MFISLRVQSAFSYTALLQNYKRSYSSAPEYLCVSRPGGRLPAEWAEACLLAAESGPAGLERWLEARNIESLDRILGKMRRGAMPDPTAFDRANYITTLSASDFHRSRGS